MNRNTSRTATSVLGWLLALLVGATVLTGCSVPESLGDKLSQAAGNAPQPGGVTVLALQAGTVDPQYQLTRVRPVIAEAVEQGRTLKVLLSTGPSAAGAIEVQLDDGGEFHARGKSEGAWKKGYSEDTEATQKIVEKAYTDLVEQARTPSEAGRPLGGDPIGLVRRAVRDASELSSTVAGGGATSAVIITDGAQRVGGVDVVDDGLTTATAASLAGRVSAIDVGSVQVSVIGVGHFPDGDGDGGVDGDFADALVPFWQTVCPGCHLVSSYQPVTTTP